MAAFAKFNQFVEDLAHAVHDLKTGTTHVLKVVLTNSAPSASNALLSDITDLSTANGYTAGGATVGTITGAQTSGTFKLVGGTDPSWTASGGSIGPFRYAVLYNSTPTSPLKPLIGYWDYGTNLTVTSGNTFTVDIDQTNGILTIA